MTEFSARCCNFSSFLNTKPADHQVAGIEDITCEMPRNLTEVKARGIVNVKRPHASATII